jgi:hypothetical protein
VPHRGKHGRPDNPGDPALPTFPGRVCAQPCPLERPTSDAPCVLQRLDQRTGPCRGTLGLIQHDCRTTQPSIAPTTRHDLASVRGTRVRFAQAGGAGISRGETFAKGLSLLQFRQQRLLPPWRGRVVHLPPQAGEGPMELGLRGVQQPWADPSPASLGGEGAGQGSATLSRRGRAGRCGDKQVLNERATSLPLHQLPAVGHRAFGGGQDHRAGLVLEAERQDLSCGRGRSGGVGS